MALSVVGTVKEAAAEIILTGSLDASTAPLFQAELEKASVAKPKVLVLRLKDLEFMASAGIRILVMIKQNKQKMGPSVEVYVVAPQEPIIETLRRTGFLASVRVVDEYPPPPK